VFGVCDAGCLAVVGDGGSREVDGAVVGVDYDLDDVGVGDLVGTFEGGGESSHRLVRVVQEQLGEVVDIGGVDFRLVGLDVNDDFAIDGFDGLGDAVGAAFVVGACKDAFGVEGTSGVTDSRVVCGDENFLRQTGEAGLFVGVLDQELAGVFGEYFSGESSRSVMCGYDGYYFHCLLVLTPNRACRTLLWSVIRRQQEFRCCWWRRKLEIPTVLLSYGPRCGLSTDGRWRFLEKVDFGCSGWAGEQRSRDKCIRMVVGFFEFWRVVISSASDILTV